jgi:hypothetical protein
MERLNQPSHTECCRGKGEGALPTGRGSRTMSLKRTQGTLRAVRGERTPLKQFSLVTTLSRRRRRSLNGIRNEQAVQGEAWEGLPGSESMAREEREVRNLGGPLPSPEKSGKIPQRQEEALMAGRDSDRFIVAGEGPKSQNQRRGRRGGVSRRGNRRINCCNWR